MSTSSGITFNGSSSYASDFQSVLTRAVALASQPMNALQTEVSTLQAQQSSLSSLDATFIALQAAIGGIGSASTGSPSVSSSSSAVVPTASASALPGSYTIQVDSLGSTTTTLSKAGFTTVTDPTSQNITAGTSWTLTINGVAQTITPAGNTLGDLVSAINNSGDNIQATIVNVGSNTAPDYRLAVNSTNLAADTIQLNDGTNDVLDTLSTGANATYRVGGLSTEISSSSSTVTLSPGLTVNLQQVTTAPVTIAVAQGYTGLTTALSSLATAYNSAVDALAQNRGQNGGALTGDQIVYQLSNLLQSISVYTTGAANVGSLSDLGLTLDQTGHLSFSASSFPSSNIAAVQQFLGTTTTSGWLKTANDGLTAMTDSNTGLLQQQSNTLQDKIKSDNSQIADDQSRIALLQANLQAQLSQADAAIATLESQKNFFTQLFTATYGSSNPSTSSTGG